MRRFEAQNSPLSPWLRPSDHRSASRALPYQRSADQPRAGRYRTSGASSGDRRATPHRLEDPGSYPQDPIHAALTGHISQWPWTRLHRACGAAGDAAAVVVAPHLWDQGLGHQDVVHDAGAILTLIVGDGLFQDVGPRLRRDTGVIDQDAWRHAEGVHDRLAPGVDRCRVRHVGLSPSSPAPPTPGVPPAAPARVPAGGNRASRHRRHHGPTGE